MNYLHLGKGTVVNTAGIVGIFDLDITSQSHLTRRFLREAEQKGQIVNAAEDIPKTFVLVREGDGLQGDVLVQLGGELREGGDEHQVLVAVLELHGELA